MSTYSPAATPYPVHVEGHLEHPSRGLWLIKWLLALPHYVVLFFLWIAFFVSAVMSFVAVLFTGRYPRALFDFNVGVLRWSWRVAFYAYGANGTDRYPPFTLKPVGAYPARFEVEYPETQRTGFPLIGWWLAGIPQYVIAGLFVGGGGAIAGWGAWGHDWAGAPWFGLIGFLVVCAALVLMFRGEYPRSMFDFILGLNRWALRVAAYAAVMTPDYPPFRLDAGEDDPVGIGALTVTHEASEPIEPSIRTDATATDATAADATTADATTADATTAEATTAEATTAPAAPKPLGPGRVAVVIIAGLMTLLAIAAIVAGTIGIAFDQTQRDSSGYLMTSARTYDTSTYAIVSSSYRGGTGGDWYIARDILGKVRITTTSSSRVFIGIAPATAVNGYLGNVSRAEGAQLDQRSSSYVVRAGGRPSGPPTSVNIWSASAVGVGQQTLTWTPRAGNWRIVLMNANATPGVNADVSIGARIPHLLTYAIVILGIGMLVLAGSGAAAWFALTRRS